MSVLTAVSPGLKVIFERVGKPKVVNRPEVLRLGKMRGGGSARAFSIAAVLRYITKLRIHLTSTECQRWYYTKL